MMMTYVSPRHQTFCQWWQGRVEAPLENSRISNSYRCCSSLDQRFTACLECITAVSMTHQFLFTILALVHDGVRSTMVPVTTKVSLGNVSCGTVHPNSQTPLLNGFCCLERPVSFVLCMFSRVSSITSFHGRRTTSTQIGYTL